MDQISERAVFIGSDDEHGASSPASASRDLPRDMPDAAALDMPVRDLRDWTGAAPTPKTAPAGVKLRRAAIILATLLVGFAGWNATYHTVALGGVTRLEGVCLALLAPLFLALALWFCTAVAGFVILLRAPRDELGMDQDQPLPTLTAKNAILMPIHNEDAAAVFSRLRAMDRSLAETGASAAFDFFIISDTREASIALAEQAAFARFRREAASNAFYRLRKVNTGRKAGNVADWVRNHGASYEHMIVLDADSLMTGEAMVRIAGAMERHPGVGLIQTMPVVVNSQTLFARCLQFATRIYGRVAWTGLAWWSGSESSFWGHNAIIRTRAFAETCGLPELAGPRPFGGQVMSHDALESALLRRAGWGVHLAPYLEGSYEESPPNLLDFAARDRRWCQGNVQHIPLIFTPGLNWLSRAHLVIGCLAYMLSPLWFATLSAGVVSRLLMPEIKKAAFQWSDVAAAAHAMIDWSEIQATGWAILITGVLLFGPKILGMILALRSPALKRSFGGGGAILRSMAVEMVLSALIAPMLMFAQTRALVEIFAGRDCGWARQRREADRVTRQEAVAAMGWISVAGLALAGSFWFTPDLLTGTAPLLAGLILATPLAMIGGSAALGRKLRDMGFFVTPEERRPPAIARDALGLKPLAPEPMHFGADIVGAPVKQAS